MSPHLQLQSAAGAERGDQRIARADLPRLRRARESIRIANGLEPIKPLPDAYEPIDERELPFDD